MAKIKFTKTELKKQRDALKQFARFLPTLQLKKQQLQMEMRKCLEQIEKNKEEEEELKESLAAWISFFGEDTSVEHIYPLVKVLGIDTHTKNIAGLDVPVYQSVEYEIEQYDLFMEDSWIDDAVKIICKIIEIRAENKIIMQQHDMISRELRLTSQRVNLFEKVKIPGCKENIRTIQIYLGDMNTAGVARAKIAKTKTLEAAI